MFQAKKGFTMIELLVVLLIIGILAAVAAPMYLAHVEKAKASEAVGALALMREAEREYYTKHSSATLPADRYRSVVAGNIELDPEDTPAGLGIKIGASQYFGKGCYSVDVGGAFTSPPTNNLTKDFVIRAWGSTANTSDNDVRNGKDVELFKVEMDNSGLVRYTPDGTNWKTY